MSLIKCRSCGSNDITEILSLGEQYLSDFRTDDVLPPKYPLDLVICDECKLVQLDETTPSHELYTDSYGYESGINGMIRDDLYDIVKNINDLVTITTEDIVIDTGANDGTLLSVYSEFGPTPFMIAVDPVQKFRTKLQEHADYVVSDFFSKEAIERVSKDDKIKVITSISMFYDLDNPNTFVQDVKDLLAEDGLWVVQQNYLGTMLSQTAYCNICHEHVEYYSLLAFEHLLNRYDLEVFSVTQNGINGGSFRTYIGHKGQWPIDESVENLRQSEKEQGLDTINPYNDFASRISERADSLHALIKGINDDGGTVAILGASTRGNTLLQTSKLDVSMIPYAIERNPGKIGKKMASSQIPIVSEEEGRARKPEYCLVLPWFFRESFLERESDYLASGGGLIFPLPTVHTVFKY